MKTIKAQRIEGKMFDGEVEKKIGLFFFELQTDLDEVNILLEEQLSCTSCGTFDSSDLALLCASCKELWL